jgi:hypothetical protein
MYLSGGFYSEIERYNENPFAMRWFEKAFY